MSQTGWTDALASVALGLPILLVRRDAVPSSTRDELRRLGVRRVWVVGGANAVGRTARDQLAATGASLTEISGADRYDTAGKLAAAMPASTDAVVASGEAWADAASIAAWAAARHVPIFLTRRDTLPSESSAARDAGRTIVVGGANVVSDGVADSLPNPVRLFGSDRYETNAAVVRWAAGEGVGMTRPVIAPGTSPMDALVAGPLAGVRGSSSLLTSPSRLPLAVQRVVVQRATDVQSLTFVGGPAQIGDAAIADTVAAVQSADLLGWVNAYRASNGRAALVPDGDETDRAFSYGVVLSEQGRLSHQAPDCPNWGENVGAGDPRAVFDAWTHDSAHRTVMLMTAVDRAGPAVVTGADGRRWVVLDVCG